MQIHFALSEPPQWEEASGLGRKNEIVHLTPGLDGISPAVNEAERGLLPSGGNGRRRAAADDGRVAAAPEGKDLLWIQLQELPWRVKGDAAGEFDVGDGSWTDGLRERYADRIQKRLARHIPNLESSILGRTCLSPADLQAANVNLVHGDPYGGSLALDQSFLWRARRRTPVANGCGTSARRPIPGRGSAAGRARSWRLSCSRIRSRSGSRPASSAEPAVGGRSPRAVRQSQSTEAAEGTQARCSPRRAFGGSSSSSFTPSPRRSRRSRTAIPRASTLDDLEPRAGANFFFPRSSSGSVRRRSPRTCTARNGEVREFERLGPRRRSP